MDGFYFPDYISPHITPRMMKIKQGTEIILLNVGCARETQLKRVEGGFKVIGKTFGYYEMPKDQFYYKP